jgi:hypothetical protein
VREHDLVLALPPGEVTARQLIEAAVAAEVTAFQARAEEASLLRVLTRKSLDADLARGVVRTGGALGDGEPPAGEPGQVNVADAVDTALLAFGDGLFKVFVGERELTDDGGALPVTDGSALLFLRLVPLSGG